MKGSASVREVRTLQHSTRDMQHDRGIGHNHTRCGSLTFSQSHAAFLAPGFQLTVVGQPAGGVLALLMMRRGGGDLF